LSAVLEHQVEHLQQLLRESGEVLTASVLTGDALREILGSEADASSKISKSHLTQIGKWTQQTIPEENLAVFPTLMITEEPTRNLVIYTAESQKKSVSGWKGTPLLFNRLSNSAGWFSGGGDHQLQAASQFGRLYQASVVKTESGIIGSLAWWYSVKGISEATDEFIGKCQAGIHREVSIHVTVPNGVICSICNDAFSKCKDNADTYHYPGEKYGKQTCYMSTGDGKLGPIELSVVACPGSVAAHIMPESEVPEYSPVALREALGSSREIITIRPRQEHQVDETQRAEAFEKLKKLASAAGVSIKGFCENAGNVSVLTETFKPFGVQEKFLDALTEGGKKCSECGHTEAHDDCSTCECGAFKEGSGGKCECGHAESSHDECGNESCECDGPGSETAPTPPVVTPPAPKEKTGLFGDKPCVVCKRGPAPAKENSTPETVEEFEAALKIVVEAAEEKVQAAETERDEIKTAGEEAAKFIAALVEDTVNRAIERGAKKEDEREVYTTFLKTLNFDQLQETRKLLTAPVAAVENHSETLRQKMESRYRAYGVETNVATDEKTGKSKTELRQPTFAATARKN